MTLVEAMRCGVPVISTDCPLGPAEIVTDGVDGRLVPVGDAPALADAILDLIADDTLRHRMAEAALESAHRYDPAPIVARYDQLFATLRLGRAYRGVRRRLRRLRRLVR